MQKKCLSESTVYRIIPQVLFPQISNNSSLFRLRGRDIMPYLMLPQIGRWGKWEYEKSVDFFQESPGNYKRNENSDIMLRLLLSSLL